MVRAAAKALAAAGLVGDVPLNGDTHGGGGLAGGGLAAALGASVDALINGGDAFLVEVYGGGLS